MDSASFLRFTADLLLLFHLLIVLFIVLGQFLICLGKMLHWPWVRNPWFRMLHLSAILIVIVRSWMGVICPITTWEMALRGRADNSTYSQSFIEHWIGKILYYQAPSWVFTLCYTIFGAIVLASWFWVMPRRLKRSSSTRFSKCSKKRVK